MGASTSKMRAGLMSSKRKKEAPSWMLRVMEKNNGFNPCFFGEKIFTTTDRNPNQNWFIVDNDHILNLFVPKLMEHEMVSSNLVNVDKKNTKKKENVGPMMMKNIGKKIRRLHERLLVTLYTMSGWKFNLVLTRRSSKYVILKGREWNNVPVFANIKVGDHVEIWSFCKMEHEKLKLCLVIGKASSKGH